METSKFLLKKDEHDKGVLCDKVTIDGFDCYVTDAPIKKGQYQWFHKNESSKPIVRAERDLENDGYRKLVIATSNPNIDLPKVLDEVEVILDAIYPKIPSGVYGHTLTAQKRGVFSEGYNKSQSTHPNSDEDMIEFSDWQTSLIFTDSQLLIDKSTEELLQLWKSQQPKVIYYQ